MLPLVLTISVDPLPTCFTLEFRPPTRGDNGEFVVLVLFDDGLEVFDLNDDDESWVDAGDDSSSFGVLCSFGR